MSGARRELTFLLAPPEKRLLSFLAARLPRRVTSDRLTAIGIAGAAGTGAAYALTSLDLGWLWAASLMIAVNWFGDSLDGTVARFRRKERPNYGYYLDHVVDAVSTAAIGVGIGLSPFVDLELALLLVVAYLALSINIYLESSVFGVFRLAYGRLGPTEVRLILIGLNTLLAFLGGTSAIPPHRLLPFGNVAALTLASAMLLLLAARFMRNLRSLAAKEPLPRTLG